ncbi:MAG TPA: biotin/lipoyl-containing protein [Lacunisphaera sp.]|jgi:pyruvate/2-oxoglutarate dehydrogenase complex dihydrolipoamide acyltransferase (E2) component|nr:biotin/lipoyl-containing protein [Lacunisphaera sp.]
MSTFVIDVPMPAMGATVSELTIINLAVAPGAKVAKGQKLAELESDKSAFDFESPADGTIVAINGKAGEVKASGQPFFRMETSDESLKHLEVRGMAPEAGERKSGSSGPKPQTSRLVWTPRAIKLAQEAGLDHAAVTDITATGPGGRVSGDDVANYLAARR